MPEMGALLFATQAMAAPGELLNLSLNATAVLPEAAVLFAMIATLLVDLAGEQVAARWVPPICYLGLGGSLLLLALQWNGPLEPAFLGAFLGALRNQFDQFGDTRQTSGFIHASPTPPIYILACRSHSVRI